MAGGSGSVGRSRGVPEFIPATGLTGAIGDCTVVSCVDVGATDAEGTVGFTGTVGTLVGSCGVTPGTAGSAARLGIPGSVCEACVTFDEVVETAAL